MNKAIANRGNQFGTGLLEVLITIVILAFGLLGLAGLHTKMQLAGFESQQRGQALVLLSDMTERLNANRLKVADYVLAGPAGTGDTQPAACSGLAVGAPKDLCEWSNALKGAAEQSADFKTGAMIGARGCITQVQAANAVACSPGIYRVTVAWQGMHLTAASSLACASGQYGDNDGYRRAITSEIVIGLPECL